MAMARPQLDARPYPRQAAPLGSPRLGVVVVNYRQWSRTARLVRQLSASSGHRRGDAEIVVVDNHSPPHPLARKLRRAHGVSLRRWRRNHGFARAVNEGCRLSRGDWILLLNPDMTLAEGFLDRALALADELSASEPRAGVVGFHLRNADGSRQLSTGLFPTLAGTLWRLLLPRSRRKYQNLGVRERCRVPWVSGCCLLVRRRCLEELEGLDESFFLYYEDVDLCRRAQRAGWSVWYEPNLAAVHHLPLHRRAVPALLRLVTRHSLLTYAAKYWPGWQNRVLRGLIRCEAFVRRLWSSWRGDPRQAEVYAELGRLVGALRRRGAEAARRRLERLVQKIDLRIGV